MPVVKRDNPNRRGRPRQPALRRRSAREVGAAVVECGALNTLGIVTYYLDDVKGLHHR
jgi:hypothetical protein